MTKDIYQKLEPWRGQLKSCVKSKFIRLSQGEMKVINGIHKELFGTELSKSQMTCNTCRLNACVRIGNEIIKYEDWHAKRNKSKEDSNLATPSTPDGE